MPAENQNYVNAAYMPAAIVNKYVSCSLIDGN